jgi:hypothetical protein
MDDLMAHIDRRPVFLQGALDDLDGAYDPRAKTTGLSQYHFHPLPPGRAAGAALRRKGTADQDPSNALAVRNNWPHSRDNQAWFRDRMPQLGLPEASYGAEMHGLSSRQSPASHIQTNGLVALEVSRRPRKIFTISLCHGFRH